VTASPPPVPRAQRREERERNELADAIERAWRAKFGDPTVFAEVQIARIRRGE
jgi:hypothetical protein